MSFLEIRNLCKSFDTTPIINDFSIEIVERTLCCLVGPNGAGKTTTHGSDHRAAKADVRAGPVLR